MPLHPIIEQAQISVDFPDKAYIGGFARDSQFAVSADRDSVGLRLVRPSEDRREAALHLHYGLLADVLCELAHSLAAREPLDDAHRAALSAAAKELTAALAPAAQG
ncbi:MAG TPA: hypothetical protein VGR91_07180 [Stellaceae bacterium]|nr:hypothetical protein [Stellaceae bacterium]